MKFTNKKRFRSKALCLLLSVAAVSGLGSAAVAQESPKEEDFFRIAGVSTPEDALLEVGGLTVLPNGDLGISTRRGEVYIVENPTSLRPYFRKYATGLHEILGLAYKEGALYAAQRGELTKLVDRNMDVKADVYETVYNWPLSGHYHEYSFGPMVAPDGTFFVSGNVAFGDEQWYRGESRVPWRGWIMNINEIGQMQPWATGVRSPAGLGMIDGQLFYTDNQGDWMGSGALWHVTKGAFMGHPAGLRWAGQENSPIKLTKEQHNAVVDGREIKNAQGRYIKPENIEKENYVTLFEAKEKIPALKLPAVWLPHGILGVSNSEPIKIPEDYFGPFGGQVLVGDQGMSLISRVFLEQVNGEYQGAAFLFRTGFQSGVLRMAWAKDGSLFVGETNRGWGSAGDENQGLQRLVWNNAVPFEMRAVRAMPDGFEIEFTEPVDRKSAEDIASYTVSSFIYKYHPVYGSPPVSSEKHAIKGVKVSEDGMKARIVVNNPRRYYIHNITLDGVRSRDNSYSLVHPTAFYTLNNIPSGQKLLMSDLSTTNSVTSKSVAAKSKPSTSSTKSTTKAIAVAKPVAKKKVPVKAVASTKISIPTYAEIKPLLTNNTCLACHNTTKKQIGPAFVDVAKRNYSNKKIVQLIHKPEPSNWPGYATEMPPMPQVSNEDALKIAAWINSLK